MSFLGARLLAIAPGEQLKGTLLFIYTVNSFVYPAFTQKGTKRKTYFLNSSINLVQIFFIQSVDLDEGMGRAEDYRKHTIFSLTTVQHTDRGTGRIGQTYYSVSFEKVLYFSKEGN